MMWIVCEWCKINVLNVDCGECWGWIWGVVVLRFRVFFCIRVYSGCDFCGNRIVVLKLCNIKCGVICELL